MENLSIYITIPLVTTALFMAMILQLAAKPKFAAKVTGTCIVLAGIGGLAFYGTAFADTCDNPLLAIVRALLAVCGMYVGKVDVDAVRGTVFFLNDSGHWAELLFYLAHLCALYATASAAIATVGGEALQKLRLWLARRGELNLIYGITDRSVDFGKALLAEKKGAVVFIGKSPDSANVSTIIKAGGAVRTDDNALCATVKFLRAVGIRPGSRKITLYTMHPDPTENLPYAKAFLSALDACGISARQTSLVIPAAEDATVSKLQVLGERYGYGYVTCYREADLAARLLTKLYPPCDTMTFDKLGRATNNFNALLIGFGKIGQAVLRQLVMNGQFVNSRFRVTVFATDCMTENGFFNNSFAEIKKNYKINFRECNAHNKEFYTYIRRYAHTLNYVVISAGNDKTNREIAENLNVFFHRLGITLPIYLCAYSGVSCCMPDGSFTKSYTLYQPKVISTHMLDRMAMELNATYVDDRNKTAEQHWMECDYFSRMSSRASADFVPAILRAAGKTEEDVLNGDWSFSQKQLDVLGEMEHLRWNAFHHCMGFNPMTDEEFNSRAEDYLRRKQTNPNVKNEIRKNMVQRTHACLIPWDQLDAYSRKENAVTGGSRNYRKEDIKNILDIPKLIQCSKEERL